MLYCDGIAKAPMASLHSLFSSLNCDFLGVIENELLFQMCVSGIATRMFCFSLSLGAENSNGTGMSCVFEETASPPLFGPFGGW